MNNNRLILISVYFGKLPSYFQLFLNSCGWNPEIDWIIFTDDKTAFNIPKNLKIEYTSLSAIRNLAKSRLGTWIQLNRAYKLCDFKPSYGILFSEYTTNYKYWGHCDIDLVWGDLWKTINPLLTKDNIRIFKYGHLSIYRNNDTGNNLFKLSYSGIQYKQALSTKISCAFDESKCTWLAAKENNLNIYHNDICFDIKSPSLDRIITSRTSTNYNSQCFIIDNGHIYQIHKSLDNKIVKEERAYIHFQKRNPIFETVSQDNIYQLAYNRFIALSKRYNLDLCIENNLQNYGYLRIAKKNLNETVDMIRFNLFKRITYLKYKYLKQKI